MKTILMLIILLLSSCGKEKRQFEVYQIAQPADILLSVENHPHGYGESQCFECHVVDNIHRDNQTGSSTLDLARELTRTQGISSCQTCHGGNGL